jgi:hypothetical protein
MLLPLPNHHPPIFIFHRCGQNNGRFFRGRNPYPLTLRLVTTFSNDGPPTSQSPASRGHLSTHDGQQRFPFDPWFSHFSLSKISLPFLHSPPTFLPNTIKNRKSHTSKRHQTQWKHQHTAHAAAPARLRLRLQLLSLSPPRITRQCGN